jgi:O-antigen/teichoic acid export membrane protein
MVTWLQSQSYTYVLAAMLGPAGVGQANAARIFISPFSFLLPAVNQIAMPRLAELRHHAPHRLLRVGVLITAALLLLALLYTAVLLQTLSLVTQTVLGHTDPTVQSLIWIWCVVVINQMILNGGSNILQVMRQFRVLTLLNLISAVTALLAACALVQVLDAPGAIWAVAVGEVLLSILIWRDIRGAHGRRR